MRFQSGDRVLYCPRHREPIEADVISSESGWTTIHEIDEEEPAPVQNGDLYLLSPRRPFLLDVEINLRPLFDGRIGSAMRRYWVAQLPLAESDDASLVALLKQVKTVRAEATLEARRAFDEACLKLRAAFAGCSEAELVARWREEHRTWRQQFTPDWTQLEPAEEVREAAAELHLSCVEAADRMGLDEIDL